MDPSDRSRRGGRLASGGLFRDGGGAVSVFHVAAVPGGGHAQPDGAARGSVAGRGGDAVVSGHGDVRDPVDGQGGSVQRGDGRSDRIGAPADLTGGRFASERGRDQLQRGPDPFERRDRSATSPWTPTSAPACTWTSRCRWVLSVETRGRDTARVRFALLDEGRG